MGLVKNSNIGPWCPYVSIVQNIEHPRQGRLCYLYAAMHGRENESQSHTQHHTIGIAPTCWCETTGQVSHMNTQTRKQNTP